MSVLSERSCSGWLVLGGGLIFLTAVSVTAGLFLISFLVSPPEFQLGDEQTFQGLDGHLKISVQAHETEPTSRPETTLHRLELQARNDATGMEVNPSSLSFVIYDGSGARYGTLTQPAGWNVTLAPGESQRKRLEFRLPSEIVDPTLWIYPDDWVLRFTPGGRRSPLTPKLTFKLSSASAQPVR